MMSNENQYIHFCMVALLEPWLFAVIKKIFKITVLPIHFGAMFSTSSDFYDFPYIPVCGVQYFSLVTSKFLLTPTHTTLQIYL